ncbi:hypothetical protein [Paraburkholderia adhaesiva]|uniref:hypothetical protein n=1 Tax=Paraburkholderia adhaesiva TaxID=2883244 RepID=UPI001F32D18F|nr:hypothetical protein [Paraburkholderia adhaesiva]
MNADPQGFWQGTDTNGRAVAALVLETGQYFSVYSTNGSVGGMVEGTLTVSGNTITDNSAIDFVVGSSAVSATVAGTATTKQLIAVKVSEPSQSVSFTGTYNASYDSSPSPSAGVGTWTGSAAGGAAVTTITVAADNSFTGSSGTCTFNGSVAPRASGKNVFDGNVTFNDASCQLGAGTKIGFEAVIANNQMVAAGVNPSRTAGFVFLGTKG